MLRAMIEPARALFMHIDVINWCAVNFGEHYHQIDAAAKNARHAGVPVCGISYDSSRRVGRRLPYAEARERFDWEQSLKVEPAPMDFLYEKTQASALHGPGSALLADFLLMKAPKVIGVGGYYADQCVLQTLHPLVQLLPDTSIIVFSDLCRALKDEAALPAAVAAYPKVHMVTSTDVPWLQPPPKPEAPARTCKAQVGALARCAS